MDQLVSRTKKRVEELNPGSGLFAGHADKNKDFLGRIVSDYKERATARLAEAQDEERRRNVAARALTITDAQERRRQHAAATQPAHDWQRPVPEDPEAKARHDLAEWAIADPSDPFSLRRNGKLDTKRIEGLRRDPYGFAASSANENLNNAYDDPQGTYELLTSRGMPQESARGLLAHLDTPEGQSRYRRGGASGAGGVIDTAVSESLGGGSKARFAGSVAGSLAYGIPYGIGPVLGAASAGAASGSTDPSDPRLWAEMGQVVQNVALPSKGVNALEGAIVKKTGSKFAQNFATKTAARVAARAGINVAEDVPLTAAQLAANGIDPFSKEGRAILLQSGGISAATGAAMPLAGDVAQGAFKGRAAITNPVVRGAADAALAGGATYGVSKATGADDEDSLRRAAIAAGAVGALKASPKIDAGLARLQGRAGRPAAIGLGTEDVSGSGENLEKITVYHGTAGELKPGGLRKDSFVTTNPDDAMSFARAEARLNGGEPRVIEFNADRDALRPVDEESVAGSRGAMQVDDPARVYEIPQGGRRPDISGTELFPKEIGQPGRNVNDELTAGILGSRPETGGEPVTVYYAGNRALAKDGVLSKNSRVFRDQEEAMAYSRAHASEGVPRVYEISADPLAFRETPDGLRVQHPELARYQPMEPEAFNPPAVPDPALQKEARDDIDSYLSAAITANDGPGATARILRSFNNERVDKVNKFVHGVIVPASNYATPKAKRVLDATVASANYLRTAGGTQSVRAQEALRALAPLTGDMPGLDGRAIAAKAVAGLVPAAVGEAATQLTGDEQYREYGIMGGVAGMIGAGKFAKRTEEATWAGRPWETVPHMGGARGESLLPDQVRSGVGKLYNILQHPDDYLLSEPQKAAVDSFRVLREQDTAKTNAFLAEAGMEPIQLKADHGILQFFTKDSVRKVLGEPGEKAFDMQTPGFSRKFGSEQQRQLGDDYVSVYADPHLQGLRMMTPVDLLNVETKMHDQMRANAMLVSNLKNSGGAIAVKSDEELAKLPPTERNAYNQYIRDMKANYSNGDPDVGNWSALPGIDDHIFHPEIVKAVDGLLLDRRGKETGPLKAFDVTSNVLRELMFSGDLSAWTMQGAMLAINDPLSTIRNWKPLVGSSVFGKKYFDQWVSKNPKLWEDFTKSGGATSFELERREAGIPLIHGLEERGFSAFLPIHRALMWANENQVEAAVRGYGKAPSSALGQTAKRAAIEFARNGPVIAGLGAAIAGVDMPFTDDDKMEATMAVALGFGTGFAVHKLAGFNAAYDANMGTEYTRARAAKHVNATSGTLNRQQYGITAEQAQWERILGARSPALTRNTIILAKKALTDFGPEGAMARFYLLKTALLVGAGMAMVEFATTGEMPSLDPRSEDSVFNPSHFLKADSGPLGKFSTSNPVIALARAAMKVTPTADDAKSPWRFKDWNPVVGLTEWYAGRMPDLVGPALGSKLTGKARELTGAPKSTFEDNGYQLPVPLPVRAAFDTGAAQATHIGGALEPVTDKLGLAANENVDSVKERVAGIAAPLLGLNTSPETKAAELRRYKTEASQRYASTGDRNGDGRFDYADLNRAQQENVRGELKDNERYQQVADSMNGGKGEAKSNTDQYFDQLGRINDDFASDVGKLDEQYKAKKLSGFAFKSAYQGLMNDRRIRIDETRQGFGGADYRPGSKYSVLEYLDKDAKPEDLAVDDWYSLFDKAMVNGKLDFDKLEALQASFKGNLSKGNLVYLNARIKSSEKPSQFKSVQDYEAAKLVAAPFWAERDRLFNKYKAGDPMLSQFESYSDLMSNAELYATENDLPLSEVQNSLNGRRAMKSFNNALDDAQSLMRRNNPQLDQALVKFYNRAPTSTSLFKRRRNKFRRSVEFDDALN